MHMGSRPALNYLVSATDTLEDLSELSHAIIRLTSRRVETMLARIEVVRKNKQQDINLCKMSYWDWGGVSFHETPENYYDEMAEKDHPNHADYLLLEDVRDQGEGRLFVTSPVLEQSNKIRTDCDEMMVREDGIIWTANYRNDSHVITTGELPVGELLVARLYYSPEAEWDQRFAELARHDPELAVSLIEQGLTIQGIEPINVAGHLSPETLAGLLTELEQKNRERIILALDNFGRKAASKPQRRPTR